MNKDLASLAREGHAAGALESCPYAGGHARAAWALGRLWRELGHVAPSSVAALDAHHIEADGAAYQFQELELELALIPIARFWAPITLQERSA